MSKEIDEMLKISVSLREELKGLKTVTKYFGKAMDEIHTKHKQSTEYGNKNSEGNVLLKLQLQLAYLQGWNDCNKFHEENKEE